MDTVSPLVPASSQAAAIVRLFYVDLVISAVILVVVTSLVVTVILRSRRHGAASHLPEQRFGNEKLEWTWTIIPLLVVTGLFIYTLRIMNEVDPRPASRAPDVEIVAHQWWWEVHYLPSGAITANEIHIPVGKDLLFRVTSADVIHDFWVPALGQKVDAIPNHPNFAWYNVEEAGTYLGTCAEFCGAEHAWMRIRVVAEADTNFTAWVQEQLRPAREPTGTAAVAGAQRFAHHTCRNCHSIRGTGADGDIGPDLTHLASRETLAAGVFENTPENLLKWIRYPQRYKPGSHMPNMDLNQQTFEEIAAYLGELR